MHSSSDDFISLEPIIGIDSFDPFSQNSPWLSHNSHYIGPRCTGMKDINQCISLTRISIILGYYKEWIQEKMVIQQSVKETKQEMNKNIDEHDIEKKEKEKEKEKEEKIESNANDNLIYDFINNVFDSENGYSNFQLLNDFHHLIDSHSHQFEAIHDRIIKQCDQNITTSYCSKRNYRNKTSFDKETNDKSYFATNIKNIDIEDDKYVKEICIQQILDTIYCYYVYSIQIGYVETENIKNEIKSIKIKRGNTDSKDDNDDDDMEQKKKIKHAQKPSLIFKSFGRASFTKKPIYKKQKEVNEMMNLFDLLKNRRKKHEDELSKELYQGIYRTENNRFSSIIRFADHRNDDNKQKQDNMKIDDDDDKDDIKHDEKKSILSAKDTANEFGYRYYYTSTWKSNKNPDIYNIGYKYKNWYIKSQYESLKEESLSVFSLCPIEIEQWNEIFEKTNNFLQTDICKKMKAEYGYKESCEIEGGSMITINHIVAVLLYTNFQHIEFQLNATYHRNPFNKETTKSLKDRHSHLALLGRYLSECVQIFGKKSGYSKKIDYYHIINKSIDMPSSILYNAPLSVTSSKMVAINALYSYSYNISNDDYINVNDDGLLLMIGGRDSKHFDCKWFSDYTNEKEKIFMNCKTAITIQNVIDIKLGLNYHLYLYSYSVINSMLNGGNLEKLQGMHFEVEFKTIHSIYSYLYHKFYGKENLCIDSLPLYIEQILNSYFSKLSEIRINWNELNKSKRKVTGHGKKDNFNIKILSLIQPFIMYYNIEWIKWHLLCKAFKKLKCITIIGIKLTYSIFEDILFQIKNLSMNNQLYKNYSIQKVILRDAREYQLAFSIAHEKYNEKFKKLKWEMANPQFNVFEIRRIGT